jgi:hypothetical protein
MNDPRRSFASLAALVAVVVLLAMPTPAHADGDPPSDFLLSQDTFVPLKDAPSKASMRALGEATRRANEGLPLKVAVVGSPVDLGTAGDLWGKPASYAPFLHREIKFTFRGTLLVVMPSGTAAAGPKADAVLRTAKGATTLRPGMDGTQLTDAATEAVDAVAEQYGTAAPKKAASKERGQQFVLRLVVIVAVVLLFAVMLGIWIAQHSRSRRAVAADQPAGDADDAAGADDRGSSGNG